MELGEARRLLGVDQRVTRERLKVAYLGMLTVWYPDQFRAGSNPHQIAVNRTQQIKEAYQVLTTSYSADQGSIPFFWIPILLAHKVLGDRSVRQPKKALGPTRGPALKRDGHLRVRKEAAPPIQGPSSHRAAEMLGQHPNKRKSMGTPGVRSLLPASR